MQNFANYFAEFTNGAIALRLLLAAVLGCVIGLERATKHHPAGMRTFALVCLGAAASAVVNIYLGTALGVGRTDMGRIPAGVVSGIGFLGVGTIIITGKNQVRGLTTAARIVDNGNPWNYVGIRNAGDQSDDVCTDHCHNVRNCQSQSCAGAVQSLHWSVYGN